MNKFFLNSIILTVFSFLFACKSPQKQDNIVNKETAIKISEEIITINGLDHYIKKIGQGEPMVVLHGGPGLFHDYLTPHFKVLAAKYQIIFYDQRGCGKTTFPKDTSTINMENYIDDLEAIRNHLKIDKINLIGHSWGAILAINYGKKYPDNLSRLMLVSPAPSTSEYFEQTFNNMQVKRNDEDTKALIELMMSKKFQERDPETFTKTTILNDKVNIVNQNDIERLYEPMVFNKKNANNLLLISSIMEKTFFNYNLIEGIEVINCPTIIITGDADNVPFSSTQLIADNIKGAHFQVIKGSAHYPFFESPKEFNKIIKNFIAPEYQY